MREVYCDVEQVIAWLGEGCGNGENAAAGRDRRLGQSHGGDETYGRQGADTQV